MDYILSIIIDVMANVVASVIFFYVSKWLDGDNGDDQPN